MGSMATRTAIYVRISDARDGETAGVDRQEKDCRRLAKQLGWSVTEVFVENNTSAYKRKKVTLPNGKVQWRVVRKVWSEMLDRCEAGDFNAIVAYDLDRAVRDPRDFEDVVDLHEHYGVDVRAVTGSLRVDTDADITMGRAMVAFANKSSRDTGRRVSRAHEESAIQGKFAGGRRRMGYTKSADALHPEEAPEIRWAYEHMAAGGTLEAIVRRWRKKLGTGPLGGVITGVQVRDVLLRPMNAGLSFYKGAEVGRMDPAVPRIIDEDTWRTVHAILMDPSRRTTVGKPAQHLLSSVLKCGQCTGRMGGRYRRDSKAGRKDPVYACREGHVSRHRERLDEAVSELVLDYLIEHAAMLRAPAPTPSGPSSAAQEAAELRARLDALSQLFAAGDIDPADYAMATRRVRERLDAIEERLIRTSSRPATLALLASDDVAAAWQAADIDAKRTVIKELVERITVNRNRPGPFTMKGVEVDWRYGREDVEAA